MIDVVIDLSHLNPDPDFVRARAAGIVGVIHKATQGTDFVDPTYAARREAARAAGLLWGAYHFATGADAVAQADHYLGTRQGGADELMALDLEADRQGPSMTLAGARAFVTHVREATGRSPGLYGGQYIRDLLGSKKDPVLGSCWLWLAQYSRPPEVPPAWKTWTLWQYTDGAAGEEPGQVAGVGRCDRDRFNGSMKRLRVLWGVPPA